MTKNPFDRAAPASSSVLYPKIDGEKIEARQNRIVADSNDRMWFNADPGKRRTDIEWFCDKSGSYYLAWRA